MARTCSILIRSLLAAMILVLPTRYAWAADCVSPSSEVVNGVTIRAAPSTSSETLGILKPGKTLPFIGSVPHWNEAALAGGQRAFVSKRWTDVRPCPDDVPPAGAQFEMHVIDVGTGLAVLVRGPDFTLLYDGGSNDDLARGNNNRLLAYLNALTPAVARIDHLVVSHPHRDHVELLPDVVKQWPVREVWDSGAFNDICGYRHLLEAIAGAAAVNYHTPNQHFGERTFDLATKTCYGNDEPANTVALRHGSRMDEQPIRLGQAASMTLLHVDGSHTTHFNDASIVVRLDLGEYRVLLSGDAEAGGRKPPSSPPSSTSIEGKLLACCPTALKSDVLVVGHHGSRTSSRVAFLDVVGAQHFIISSGPTKYGTVVLPDEDVLTELTQRGQVFRTDRDDVGCASASAKIGPDNDGKPGGCDNIVVILPPGGLITAEYSGVAD